MDKIEVIKDPKQDIEFWLNALSNEYVNMDNKELLNKCLQIQLNRHLYPPALFVKTDPFEYRMVDTSKMKYMGDLKAAERLKNDSICVIENGQIRNLKEGENTKGVTLVHVNNFPREDKDNEYIEQGEYVRYTTY
jgi:hypothetical protein